MQKIIDFHNHLGDIFAYQKNVIYKLGRKFPDNIHNPFKAFADKKFQGAFVDPTTPGALENLQAATVEACRNYTLEVLTRELDEDNITYVCLYPIYPHIGFEDYLAASRFEPRIIPFTSADWSKDKDTIGRKLLKDVEHGARGLKIHPVLQPISLRDPLVKDVLNEYWSLTGLPVVSHCGANAYYDTPEMQKLECPEYGDVQHFIWLVKQCPKVKMVAAHAGGLMGDEMEVLHQALPNCENLWVDTTFRSAEDMRKQVEYFGADRVLFGSDSPFSPRGACIETVKEAFGEGSDLYKKVIYQNAADLLQLY
ncbi:amidohydrolase family protein [Zophobihabitans entericus]|uniref:Amidohydrolase family protein n=1 Tax=Zophobihabitans entericus TaxID=1635327 RepID=A0A6G9I8L2_9GAMM|nr:amidohydrolase family protein [Zophobihabitans entericus]QIQ20558.1 amidohydrolase family protein [Zophobihabitans entericus]